MTLLEANLLNITHNGPPQLAGFGLPFSQGALVDVNTLALFLNGQPLDCEVSVRNRWPDASVRWCWCRALIHESGTLSARLESAVSEIDSAVSEIEKLPPPSAVINTENQDSGLLGVALSALGAGPELQPWLYTGLHLTVCGQTYHCPLQSAGYEAATLESTHRFTGVVTLGINRSLNTELVLRLCKKTKGIKLRVKLHNPHRAAHQTGRWDLGDPMSVVINKFAISFTLNPAQPELILETVSPPDEPEHDNKACQYLKGPFTLSQHGSGGEHWQSPIHWDDQQKNTVKARGFTLTHAHQTSEGLRAQPVALLRADTLNTLAITQHDFWQLFPSEVTGAENTVRFGLFPDKTELQGGESKTWRFSVRLISADLDAEQICATLLRRPVIVYNAPYLNHCRIMPHLSLDHPESAFTSILQLGLYGAESFFKKRERMDCYGWRHFGELHADHETSQSDSPETFVSHYNNQYDPLMGMTLQYMTHGNTDWLHLIHPLAQHVIDIDIYDTTEDKAEYNGGLFWHTDHYLPAYSSTHRSYSRFHTAVYEGYAGGGGPGGQHCYTTGLALQYWLFGHEQARDRVKQLTHWIDCFYNGSGSILDRTFRLLTLDFKRNVLTNIGIKKPGYRYPLDRGTGNYIVALLDTAELSGQWNDLEKAAKVIRQSVHPKELLEERRLLDVENAWFYTVFLQSVARFLCLKEQLQQIDNDYWYARHSFMHYLDWMLENENFYLNHPEKLEFPNDTWAAQDIRKANLFCYGFYFAATEQPAFLEAAERFYQYIQTHLSQSPERHYTRILAILMQNMGVREKFSPPKRSTVPWQTPCDFGSPPDFSPWNIVSTYWQDVLKLLKHLSPAREVHWLKIRFGKR